MESHSPLGTLWAGLGMGAYFTALLWINILLGNFLSPLFLIPMTWLLDRVKGKRKWNEPETARQAVEERRLRRASTNASATAH